MNDLIRKLKRIRFTAWRLLIQTHLSRVVLGVIIYLAVVGTLDHALRLPEAIRFILLLAAAAAIVWVAVDKLVPALRFRPTLVEMALRVEEHNPAVKGRLASAVDLSLCDAGADNDLARRSILDATEKSAAVTFGSLLAPKAARWFLFIAFIAAGAAASFVAARPAEASIALRRTVLPFGSAQWPARTQLASSLDVALVHPRGEPLVFVVDLVKGDPAQERVDVRFRYTRAGDGEPEPWRDLQMTRQSGTRFERVIDTDAEAVEYAFHASDSQTTTARVKIVEAPAVLASHVVIEPPAYASATGERQAELGTGTDRRARLDQAVLKGSRATMVLRLNRPLPAPTEATFELPASADPELVEYSANPSEPTEWTIAFTLLGSGDVALRLEDEDGLSNLDPIRFRFDTVDDREPTVTISKPAADEAVTADAVVLVLAEARDDIQLQALELELAVHHQGERSRVEIVGSTSGELKSAASLAVPFDVAPFELTPGDEIVLIAIASDHYLVDGVEHDRVRSAPRRLRIVGASAIAEDLRQSLASIRRTAIRLEGEQALLQESIEAKGFDDASEREQVRITDRLASAAEAMEAIGQRRDQNRLTDEMLDQVLEQGSDLLAAASRASAAATEAIEGEGPEAQRDASEAQDTVRAELTDLAALLDRDEDAWVVTQRVQQMRERLEETMTATAELAEETLGRERSELSDSERASIDELARDQAEEQEEARDLIEELEERARALSAADPAQAAGLRAAANEGREGELEENMGEASEASRNNQLQQAGEAQEAAAEALDRMMEEIEESRKARIEELSRQIASLVESLKVLVGASEDELIALARLEDLAGLNPLAERLMRLNRNTLAVAAEARTAGTDGARIARLVDRAVRSQGAAIGSLRANPPQPADARDEEERALASLKEALVVAEEQAERIAEQQAEEARRELKEAYSSILDAEIDIRVESESIQPAPGERLGRRGLVAARRLALQQHEVGERLAETEADFTEITDSLVFSMAHRNLTRWIEEIRPRLTEGAIDGRTLELETMVIDGLAGLLSALADQRPEDDPFAEGDSAGGGGEQQGGGEGQPQPQPLIPPIAELKALRAMQQQVLDATQRLDQARAELGSDTLTARLEELGSMQADLHAVGSALLTQLEPTEVEPETDR